MDFLDFLLQNFIDELVLLHCRQALECVACDLDCKK